MTGKALKLRVVKQPAQDHTASAYQQQDAGPVLPVLPLLPSCSFNQHICVVVTEAPPETVNLTNLWSWSGSRRWFSLQDPVSGHVTCSLPPGG